MQIWEKRIGNADILITLSVNYLMQIPKMAKHRYGLILHLHVSILIQSSINTKCEETAKLLVYMMNNSHKFLMKESGIVKP